MVILTYVSSLSIPDDLVDYVKQLKTQGKFSGIAVSAIRDYKQKMESQYKTNEEPITVQNYVISNDRDFLDKMPNAVLIELITNMDDLNVILGRIEAKYSELGIDYEKYRFLVKIRAINLVNHLANKLKVDQAQKQLWTEQMQFRYAKEPLPKTEISKEKEPEPEKETNGEDNHA